MLLVLAQAEKGASTVSFETVAISAGAILLAAIIAAMAAQLRLRKQLTAEQERLDSQLQAERERLQAQLNGEGERLAQQLTHDRRLAELEQRRQRQDELRVVVELAGVRYTETLETLNRVRHDVGQAPTAHQREAVMQPLREHISQLIKNTDRLSVRLGGEAAIVQRWAAAVEVVTQAETVLSEVVAGEPLDPERNRTLRRAHTDAVAAQGAFYEATSETIGPEATSQD